MCSGGRGISDVKVVFNEISVAYIFSAYYLDISGANPCRRNELLYFYLNYYQLAMSILLFLLNIMLFYDHYFQYIF